MGLFKKVLFRSAFSFILSAHSLAAALPQAESLSQVGALAREWTESTGMGRQTLAYFSKDSREIKLLLEDTLDSPAGRKFLLALVRNEIDARVLLRADQERELVERAFTILRLPNHAEFRTYLRNRLNSTDKMILSESELGGSPVSIRLDKARRQIFASVIENEVIPKLLNKPVRLVTLESVGEDLVSLASKAKGPQSLQNRIPVYADEMPASELTQFKNKIVAGDSKLGRSLMSNLKKFGADAKACQQINRENAAFATSRKKFDAYQFSQSFVLGNVLIGSATYASAGEREVKIKDMAPDLIVNLVASGVVGFVYKPTDTFKVRWVKVLGLNAGLDLVDAGVYYWSKQGDPSFNGEHMSLEEATLRRYGAGIAWTIFPSSVNSTVLNWIFAGLRCKYANQSVLLGFSEFGARYVVSFVSSTAFYSFRRHVTEPNQK